MRKYFTCFIVLSSVVLSFMIAGCGGGSGTSVGGPSVSGVVASGAPIAGTVFIKDSSSPGRELTAQTAADGSFSFDVSGMTPPFALKAEWTTGGNRYELYSGVDAPGTANINPLSNLVIAGISGAADPSDVFSNPGLLKSVASASARTSYMDRVRAKTSPLFEMYGANQDPITDNFKADHTGMDALFDDVDIEVNSGDVEMLNRDTRGRIFWAHVDDIESGLFDEGNVPSRPGMTDGVALYEAKCSSCHGVLAESSKKGATASQIRNAVNNNYGGMGRLSNLTDAQLQAIADALATSTTPAVETDGAQLYTNNCTSCHGVIATSNIRGKSASDIKKAIREGEDGMPVFEFSDEQIQAIADALSTTTSTCTYTYSAWGTCQSDNTQSRSVISSSPAGCTGTPLLSQACNYSTPACTYTYSGWGACQPDNTQSRSVISSSPAGCAGTPVLTQACSYTPPATLTLAQVTASCTSCHGLKVNSTVFRSGGYTVTGRSASAWLTSVNNMVGYGASLASGFTAQDYANFLATLP